MKEKLLIIILGILVSVAALAQNDMKARLAYEDAETAFAAEDYQTAVTYLSEAETLLGKWTSKVGYLMIMSLDKTLDYAKPDEAVSTKLRSEIDQYLKFADNNTISTEKAREVLEIDKILQLREKELIYKSDPDYLKGLEEFKAKRYDEAIVYFKKAYTTKGNKLAEAMLGNAYVHKAMPTEALDVYQRSVKDKNPYAMENLGNLYFYGEKSVGIEKDFDKGLYYCTQAAELGNLDAITSLIRKYTLGSAGFKKNSTEELKWIEKCAKFGSAFGYHMLANKYSLGDGVERDMTKSAYYARIAAAKGDSGGMLSLSNFYQTLGKCQEAIKWALKAIEKGNYVGYMHLSLIYRDGCSDVEKNIAKANEYQSKYEEERNKN